MSLGIPWPKDAWQNDPAEKNCVNAFRRKINDVVCLATPVTVWFDWLLSWTLGYTPAVAKYLQRRREKEGRGGMRRAEREREKESERTRESVGPLKERERESERERE